MILWHTEFADSIFINSQGRGLFLLLTGLAPSLAFDQQAKGEKTMKKEGRKGEG